MPEEKIFRIFLLDFLLANFFETLNATFLAGSKNFTFGKSSLKSGNKNGKCVLERVIVSIDCFDKILSVFLIIFLQSDFSERNFPDSTNSTRIDPSILKI